VKYELGVVKIKNNTVKINQIKINFKENSGKSHLSLQFNRNCLCFSALEGHFDVTIALDVDAVNLRSRKTA
jgi:hypothetical protein